jgi:hypothetical protein
MICHKCQQDLPDTEFHKKLNGRQTVCKTCISSEKKQKYDSMTEEQKYALLQKRKEHYLAKTSVQRDIDRSMSAIYRHNKTESQLQKRKEQNHAYYMKRTVARKKEIKEQDRTKLRDMRRRFSMSKSSAKKRHKDWGISLEQFAALNALPCHYCGGALNETGIGLDRVDNDNGYKIDNVVPCCGTCNRAKHIMSRIEFLHWVERVFRHRVTTTTE